MYGASCCGGPSGFGALLGGGGACTWSCSGAGALPGATCRVRFWRLSAPWAGVALAASGTLCSEPLSPEPLAWGLFVCEPDVLCCGVGLSASEPLPFCCAAPIASPIKGTAATRLHAHCFPPKAPPPPSPGLKHFLMLSAFGGSLRLALSVKKGHISFCRLTHTYKEKCFAP